MSARDAVRGVRASFHFLTRIPVGGFPFTTAEWSWASAHFPLVGAVLGGVLGALDRALLPIGALPAAIFVLAASMLMTGAFHEDGLADTSDALGGAFDRERIVLILKDSRIGAFGAAAVVVSVVGRAALLAELGVRAAWALPLVGCAARVGPVWLMLALPYATTLERAKSRDVMRARVPQAVIATAWLVMLTGALTFMGSIGVWRATALVVALIVTTLITGWRYARRLGGITGDFLGATEQIGELVALAVLVWRA